MLVIAWELIWNKGSLDIQPVFLPFMAWRYLQLALWSLSHQTWWRRSRPRNPAGPPRLNQTLRVQPQSDVSRSSDLPSRIEFDITLLARGCDHDRGCVVVSPSSHREMKKVSNRARQALPGAYEESATLDLKRTKLEMKTKAEKKDVGASGSCRR